VKKALKTKITKKAQRNKTLKAVVGLGNYGMRYRNTRHNAGFMLLDTLAERCRLKYKAGKGDYVIAFSADRDTAYVKPLTYMNNSGIAIKDVAKRYDVSLEDMLVVHDELDLLLGRIKFKSGGSAGTHNGVRSLIEHLQDDAFPRLKIGIDIEGRREGGSSVDYVLSKFSRSEREIISEVMPLAADAVECFLSEGMEKAMNQYNQRL
jgi:peptidyl-tRNA hydrolase, PTH1 family